MSPANVDRAYQTVDAFNRRDLPAALALMHDDVEVLSRLAAMEGGYQGHDGVRRHWEHLFDAMPDMTAEAVAVHDLGDITITEMRLRGSGAGSSTPLDQTIWSVTEWRDDRCVSYNPSFTSEADARAAAQVRAPRAPDGR
jgi:ketosteroid isomerase-like protein